MQAGPPFYEHAAHRSLRPARRHHRHRRAWPVVVERLPPASTLKGLCGELLMAGWPLSTMLGLPRRGARAISATCTSASSGTCRRTSTSSRARRRCATITGERRRSVWPELPLVERCARSDYGQTTKGQRDERVTSSRYCGTQRDTRRPQPSCIRASPWARPLRSQGPRNSYSQPRSAEMASKGVAEEIRGACSTRRAGGSSMKYEQPPRNAGKGTGSALGVSEMDLQHLAHERRLPFFVRGAGGFAIMSRDLRSGGLRCSRPACCGE